jgi:hypothetical protein
MRNKRPCDWHCVYFLRDPRDGRVRYVGMTKNPSARRNAHINTQSYGVCFDWVSELRKVGLKPIFEVKVDGVTRDQAMRCESYLTARLKLQLINYMESKREPSRAFATACELVEHINSKQLLTLACLIFRVLRSRRLVRSVSRPSVKA